MILAKVHLDYRRVCWTVEMNSFGRRMARGDEFQELDFFGIGFLTQGEVPWENASSEFLET